MKFIKDLKKSGVALNKNKPLLLFGSLVDMVFFIIYGFLTSPFFFTIVTNVNTIGTIIQQRAIDFTRSAANNPSIINLLFTDPTLKGLTQELLLAYLLLGLLTYVLYVAFQGFNWNLARVINGHKKELGKYFKGFWKVNIVWFLLFVVYHFMDLIASLRQTVASGSVVLSPTNTLGIIAKVFLVIVVYFALISYNTLSVKSAFRDGFKKAKVYLPKYIVIALVFILINYIIIIIPDLITSFIVGIVLFLPSLTWARTYLTE